MLHPYSKHQYEERLQKEVQSILYGAYRRCKPEKRPCFPIIALVDGLREWGRYVFDAVAQVHRIELKAELLTEHPWYAVDDVLRHELAHFLKQFFYPCVAERPHGKLFRKMCEKIGANPAASANYPLLDEVLSRDDGLADEVVSPMEQKIRKLLALSESPNEHEAELALMKARELMAKYEVTETAGEENESDPFVTVEIKLYDTKISAQEYALAAILNDFYDVRCLGTYDNQILAMYPVKEPNKLMAVSGRRSKVKIALYVRNYIKRYINEAWHHVPWGLMRNGGVREQRDFQLGCLQGIREVLEKQNSEGNVAGLVLANKELDAYYHAHFPFIVTKRSSRKHNDLLIHAGKEAGRKMELHAGIEKSGADGAPKRLKG